MREMSWNELKVAIAGRYFSLVFVIALIVLSAFVRLYHIDVHDMWVDESNTVLTSVKDLSGVVNDLKHDASPPLYYFMLHYWMGLFGQTETAVRSLSAVFGVLLAIALFFIGKNLFTLRVGIFAAMISSVAPIQVMYSQQVRMYTLLPLTSLLSMYFLLRFIQKGTVSRLCWYVVFTVACIFTHHYGFLLLPAQALIVLCYGPVRTKVLLGAAIIGYAGLKLPVWLPILIRRFGDKAESSYHGWMRGFWDMYGFWGSLMRTLQSFSPGGDQPPYVPLNAVTWAPMAPVLICAALLLVALTPLVRRRKESTTETMMVVWLVSYGLVPLIAVGVYSMIFSPVYLAGRCDQLVFPAFCLLLGVGIDNVRPSHLQGVLLVVLVLFSLKTLDEFYKSNPIHGDREIATGIGLNLERGDAILCTSLTRASLEYYLRDSKSQLTFFSYPPGNALHLAHQDLVTPLKRPGKLAGEAEQVVRQIEEGGSRSGRFFLVYVPNRVNQFLKEHIRKNMKRYRAKRIGVFKQSLLRVPVQVLLIEFRNEG